MAFRIRIHCYTCDVELPLNQRARLDGEDNAAKREVAILRREVAGRAPMEIGVATRTCLPCMRSIQAEVAAMEQDPNCLKLNVLTQTQNASCMICNAVEPVLRVPTEFRVNIFLQRNIFVPEGCRICQQHMDQNGLLLRYLLPGLRFVNRPYIIKGKQLGAFLDALRTLANKSVEFKFQSEDSFTDDEFKSFSPVSKEQFLDLFAVCDPVLQDNGVYRYITKKHLLTFLCKLRQGLSDAFLGVVFNYSSRQNVSMAISLVRKSLMIRFVPQNLGFASITRQEFIEQHVTPFSNQLYNPEPNNELAIVYIDGTYASIPKCSNFRVLRQSYCVHKGKHLLKPVLIVGPDGHIVDIQGPYFSDAKNNDAKLLRAEYEGDVASMREWFHEGDIFVVDRGYRDAIPMMENAGIICKMPSLLPAGQRQLTTEEANASRLITKTRWIVEARNGHIKTIFKFFADVIPIQHVVHLGDFYRIAGAIINKYHPRVEMDGANIELAQQMLQKSLQPNLIQARVEAERLHVTRARWVHLNAEHVPLFPHLTLEYLRHLTVGIYQVKLAPSHVQDKLQRDGQQDEFELDELVNEVGFLRIRVYSRFRNAVRHQLWVQYRLNFGDEPISGYYCTCKSGARTLGSCAHVASVLWYLGYARYEANVKYPWTKLLEVVQDAGDRPQQRNVGDPEIIDI